MLEFEIVLPCYNESRSLSAIVERAAAAAKEFQFTSEKFKLVLVNNGSKDNSSEVLAGLQTSPLAPWFRVVEIVQNQGYGHGLDSGLKSCTALFVGYSHADQQCDPRDAFIALKALQQKKKARPGVPYLVKGERYGRSFKEVLVSRVFDIFARLFLGGRFYEINAQPKVFERTLLGHLVNPPKDFAFDVYLQFEALKHGFSFASIEVEFPPRQYGESNWAANFFSRYKTIFGMIRYMYRLGRLEGRV